MTRLLTVLALSLMAASWTAAQEDHSGMDHSAMDHSDMDHSGRSTEPAPVRTQPREADAHMDMDHSGHGSAPRSTAGSWSYRDRNNPRPHAAKDRWEMVPVPGYGHLYVSGKPLSAELRCAAVRDNPRVMVDRATRKACGMPETPAVRESRAGRAAPAGRIHAAETGSADPHAGH